MMRCKQMVSVLALVAPLAVVAVVGSPAASSDAEAATTHANLCEVTRGVCVVVPKTDAVAFDSAVCWDGEQTTVMGAGGCVSGRPFSLSYGFIDDPIANTVLAMTPVGDACGAGYCASGAIDPGALLDEGAACCNSDTGVCTELGDKGCFGEILWCKNVEDKGDGTITCHEPA